MQQQIGIWQQLTLSVLTGAVTAIIGLWVKPWIDIYFARQSETRAYASEVVELRRQLEQSRRVMEKICMRKNVGGRYPLLLHFRKMLVTNEQISLGQKDISRMSVENRLKAAQLRVILRNHNLEVEQIITLIQNDNLDAYLTMCDQLAARLGRMVDKIREFHPSGRWYFPASVRHPSRWDEVAGINVSGREKVILYG